MVLPIAYYGNPVLRRDGDRVECITPELEQLIGDMFETMAAHSGIGLAAQQVGRALQLSVIDIRPATERPSTAERDGVPVDPADLMPLVLINPEVTPLPDAGEESGSEGCLSFPEVYGPIVRPERVAVKATGAKGEKVEFVCGGLLARCVQHECDHLRGILFIDRMDAQTKKELKEDIYRIQQETKAAQRRARYEA